MHCMGGTLARKGLQLVWQMLASSVKHCHYVCQLVAEVS